MAQHRTRRVFLQSTTVGIAGLTGCTLLGSQEAQLPELVGLNAYNYDDASHTAHVRLEHDGETVYRESKQIAAAESEDVRAVVFSDYPTGAESYVLSAWRDDRPEAEARPLDFASFDTECLGLTVNIGSYGVEVENPQVSIYFTTNCRF